MTKTYFKFFGGLRMQSVISQNTIRALNPLGELHYIKKALKCSFSTEMCQLEKQAQGWASKEPVSYKMCTSILNWITIKVNTADQYFYTEL